MSSDITGKPNRCAQQRDKPDEKRYVCEIHTNIHDMHLMPRSRSGFGN